MDIIIGQSYLANVTMPIQEPNTGEILPGHSFPVKVLSKYSDQYVVCKTRYGWDIDYEMRSAYNIPKQFTGKKAWVFDVADLSELV